MAGGIRDTTDKWAKFLGYVVIVFLVVWVIIFVDRKLVRKESYIPPSQAREAPPATESSVSKFEPRRDCIPSQIQKIEDDYDRKLRRINCTQAGY